MDSMKNKLFLLVMMIVQVSSICAMYQRIDYKQLFVACKDGNLQQVEEFFEHNQHVHINHRNEHGKTALLIAGSHTKWNIVDYLLQQNGIDKNVKDNYGQTLFSKAIHDKVQFSLLVSTEYSLKEINALCKSFPRERSCDNTFFWEDSLMISLALADSSLVNSSDLLTKTTPLSLACCMNDIPSIIALLECGAHLHAADVDGNTPYTILCDNPQHLFVVREAFNNGFSCPRAMSIASVGEVVKQHLVSDLKHKIIKLYVENAKQLFETPEAKLWAPIAVKAYKIVDPQERDQQRCLTKILFMNQEEKTHMNIQYALKTKDVVI